MVTQIFLTFSRYKNQGLQSCTNSISDLTKIEFHSVFLKKVRVSEIDFLSAKKVFTAFDSDIRYFNVIEVDTIVKNFALNLLDLLASIKSLRTLDAIQLSSAIIFHQFVPINYFVCSDKKLLNVAKEYFSVFNPEKA